ncbi:HAD family hydrolase [Paenibacillus gallinarum]|uniref:HAD-IA family hydrolase n=1 Tax=Paenibacillus gallinarum TaxID=2762232 RepID=A0ABR8T0J4_9BACL|nr:HAD-IA family hydrolase [Paenibacillus gallinarum]MBD7969292.1 HAD-IA family hydrolase [Paenibacillus gallinarum]
MIKGILFDLDGTLLDRATSLVSFLENQYDRIHAFHKVEKHVFIDRFVQLDQKGYVWKDKVYQQLIEEIGIDLSWQELLEDYVESFQDHCIGFSGLFEMLDHLKEKNLKLGIISNGFGRFQMNNITGLKIDHYFDEILISETEGLRKPDIKIFKTALDRLGLEPKDSIFLGDHPINDVEASINAGMLGIWKEDDFYERPSSEYRSIKNLLELKDIFANISN